MCSPLAASFDGNRVRVTVGVTPNALFGHHRRRSDLIRRPDLAGCIAVGETRAEVLALIREAIEFHLESLKGEGQPAPRPSSTSELVEVEAA